MNTTALWRVMPLMNVPDATPSPPSTQTPAPAATTTPTSAEPAAPAIEAGWTPYTPDATKSAQENLALKEAYDAKAPKGHDPNVKLDPAPGYKPPETKPADPNAPKVETPAPALTPLLLTDLVAPEGYTIDPAMGTELVTLINQHANDPKSLVNELVKLQVKALAGDEEARSTTWDNLQNDWKKQSEADPEIGGAKYAANTALSTQLVARFGGPKMQEVLDLTGMGNHPEFLRFITKLAPFVSEAAPITPGAAVPQAQGYSRNNLYPEQGTK